MKYRDLNYRYPDRKKGVLSSGVQVAPDFSQELMPPFFSLKASMVSLIRRSSQRSSNSEG
jgi:hypothetical protein